METDYTILHGGMTSLEYQLAEANSYIAELKEEIRMLERELRDVWKELDNQGGSNGWY